MDTKIFILVVATVLASVPLAEAQKSTTVPRIDFLSPESHQSGRFEAFRQFASWVMWREKISPSSTEALKIMRS
jgi:hypothetical protein